MILASFEKILEVVVPELWCLRRATNLGKVEKFIPPKKGRTHLLRILRELLEFKPAGSGTNISEALRFLTNAIKKKCNAFLLSDLLDVDAGSNPNYEEALKIAVNRHDLSVINIYDERERHLPDVGLIRVKDAESGEERWVDTSSRRLRAYYDTWSTGVYEKANRLFKKFKVDCVSIGTDQDYVKGLIALFKSK